MLKPDPILPALPPPVNLDATPVLKALAATGRSLAELKGRAAAIPNPRILIDTLALQEALASSEIENIVTTQDELFQADRLPAGRFSAATKEVRLYRDALELGYRRMRAAQGNITNNALIDMFRLLKRRSNGGFRVTPGTALKNEQTGETVYAPPQDANEIVALMTTLERFINDDALCDLDPLIKMALIHHQFESIHPFPDGNGRIGRILNVLYLVRAGLLETPILYHSRYITRHKGDYYRLLQAARAGEDTAQAWRDWTLYMLAAVADAAADTLAAVEGIRRQMADMKRRMRERLPKLYSQDLLNNLFRHPYTRIEYVADELGVSRPTATKYLDTLAAENFVQKQQAGRANYYINRDLVNLFTDASGGG